MLRRLTVALLVAWQLFAPSGIVWAGVVLPLPFHTLAAGHDLTVQGSQAKAGNDLLAYAGNNLNVVTARETDSSAYHGHSSNVEDVRQTWRDTGTASSLKAGNHLSLTANNTLTSEGAKIEAGQDVNLQAESIVIAARHDTYSENGQYSNIGKRGSQISQTQIQTDEATGSIVRVIVNSGTGRVVTVIRGAP